MTNLLAVTALFIITNTAPLTLLTNNSGEVAKRIEVVTITEKHVLKFDWLGEMWTGQKDRILSVKTNVWINADVKKNEEEMEALMEKKKSWWRR